MKTIWMSLLSKSEEKAQKLVPQLQTYGLEAKGHFWEDDLKQMAWMGPKEELCAEDLSLWLIVATEEDLASESIRYGLSLLAIAVQAERGLGFPIVILYDGETPPTADDLPTPLKGAEVLAYSSAAYAGKLVALANKPAPPVECGYRLALFAIPALGLWFEVGPVGHKWAGAMFGVSGGDIDAHGVGAKGRLPVDKMTLNYPMQGLKLQLGEKEFVAWAVQNEIDDDSSYYLRVLDHPDSLLFGPHASGDEAEVHVVQLK